jgi:hypothetical protein
VGWQHRENRFDVTNDGHVVPSDVLTVMNELNAPVYCDPSGRLPSHRPLQAFFYDTNGDGLCTAAGDVLPIINFLNSRTAPAAGESSESSTGLGRFAVIDAPAGGTNSPCAAATQERSSSNRISASDVRFAVATIFVRCPGPTRPRGTDRMPRLTGEQGAQLLSWQFMESYSSPILRYA